MILVLRGKAAPSVEQWGSDVIVMPILKPVPDESAIHKLEKLCQARHRLGVIMSTEIIELIRDRIDLSRCIETAIAVGPSTCNAIRSAFPHIDCVMPNEYFSAAVASTLRMMCKPGDDVLVIRSKDYVEEAIIRVDNCNLIEVGVYSLSKDDDAVSRAASMLSHADAIVFASPKVFTTFLDAVGRTPLIGKKLIAIGPTTGAVMRRSGFSPLMPPRYTIRDAVELALSS